jgi:hypothetical protein
MKVLIVEPHKEAYEEDIGNDLKDLQNIVDGNIEAIYPFDEEVCIVANENGKIDGLPLNRALYGHDGEIYDIIAGKFFICGLGEEDFDSLSAELMKKFNDRFRSPELFTSIEGKIIATKVQEWQIGMFHNQTKQSERSGIDAR